MVVFPGIEKTNNFESHWIDNFFGNNLWKVTSHLFKESRIILSFYEQETKYDIDCFLCCHQKAFHAFYSWKVMPKYVLGGLTTREHDTKGQL